MNEIFNLLKKEAEKQDLPKTFQDDLYKHDKERLERGDLPSIFGWVLRDGGTYFLDIRMSKKSLEGFFDHLEENGKEHKYYIILTENKYMVEPRSFKDWVHILRLYNNILTEDRQTGY